MSGDPGSAALREIGLFLDVCRRYFRSIAILIFVGGAVMAGYSLTLTPMYRARASIFPSAILRGQDSGLRSDMLAGLSSRLGLSIGAESLDPYLLYPEVLNSRLFSQRVLALDFPDRRGNMVRLSKVLSSEDTPDSLVMYEAHTQFVTSCIRTEHNLNTAVTSIDIVLPDPVMAAAVANRCVSELEDYIHELTVATASNWTRFIEDRLAAQKAALDSSEVALSKFRMANRMSTSSPTLELELARLEREVAVNQGVFLTLRQQHEIASIETAKDVAQIAILDRAIPPRYKFRPVRTLYGLFGLFLGVCAGIAQALIRNYRNQARPGT